MQTQKPLNIISIREVMSEDEFNSLVGFFYWLKIARDNYYTQSDTIEPTNDLNYSENELKRQVG